MVNRYIIFFNKNSLRSDTYVEIYGKTFEEVERKAATIYGNMIESIVLEDYLVVDKKFEKYKKGLSSHLVIP